MMIDATGRPPATTEDSFLSGQVHLRQLRDGYRVGTDTVMLAASINKGAVDGDQTAKKVGKQTEKKARPRKRLLDMGAGVGGISLAICQRRADVHITAIERDQASYDLLCHNISVNNRTQVIRPHLGDVLALPPVLRGSFDHVFANPPFHHSSDKPSRSRRRREAHYADEAALVDWIASALWAVKSKGRISFIVRADRTDQVMRGLSDAGAGEVLLYPLWSYRSSPAIRMIITARAGVKGAMAILPGLVLHHPSGALTPEARRVMKGEGLLLRHPATTHLSPRLRLA